MRWHGFVPSLVFAAVAAAAYPVFALVMGPWLGSGLALSAYLLGVAVLYVAGIGPPGRRGHALFGAMLLALGVAALAGSPFEIAAGAALLIGVCRSGLLYRARPLRALVVEAGLLACGLGLARAVGAPTLLGCAMAIWGFGLVQSCFFLIAGREARGEPIEGIDPFELARDRALALLDEEPR